tara:strand:+ start:119799 stop:121466 length:1668 start_codon:yes stop_codon:yes gene_type:complete
MWIPLNNTPLKKHSRQLVKFQCQCRLKTVKTFPWKNFATGVSKSCGKCSFLLKEDLLNLSQNLSLILLNPIIDDLTFPISKNKKVKFNCKCGNVKSIVLKSVINGLTKSCGCLLKSKSAKFAEHSLNFKGKKTKKTKTINPNIKDPKWWVGNTFGRLTVEAIPKKPISVNSEIKLLCKCACGSNHTARVSHLTSGKIKSCGNCSIKAAEWWKDSGFKKGSYPSNFVEFQESLNGSFLKPITFSKKKPKIECLLCHKVFSPRFYDIFLKQIKSCGCASFKVSAPVVSIKNFLQQNGVKSELEAKVDNYSVDLLIREHSLIIEFNGLRYHSSYFRKNRTDQAKFESLSKNYDVIVLYSDEWDNKKDLVKNYLLSKTHTAIRTKIRPQKCSIRIVRANEVRQFYDSYHYLGFRSAKLHLGVYFEGQLVGALSIHTPSRQSDENYEIVRMCSHPSFLVHGLWSYLIKRLSSFGITGSVSSFSDNRLSNGTVYSKCGFNFIHDVKPDYWYTDHRSRFHKSKFRKTTIERASDKTEEQLRRAQGLYKIMDYGKKKWVLNLD